jgi:mono/diheme cytochrome c family protein
MSNETRGHLLGTITAIILLAVIFSLSALIRPRLPVSNLAFEKTTVDSAQTIAEGHAYYGKSCAHCHADDASGDEGPDLRVLKKSNARLAVVIKKGVPHEMPAYQKKYSDEQIHALVVYLRTLK